VRRAKRSYDLGKLRILVLEKHLLVRRLLIDVFSEFGVPTVHSTPKPEMAWDIFIQFQVDLILCDWAHGLDGMAFLARVRQDEESSDPYVPVIICTANTESQHVCTARDTGMTQFLAKPVSAKMIYFRICAVIENTRPFFRVSDFFGPDCRRSRVEFYGGLNRRKHRTG